MKHFFALLILPFVMLACASASTGTDGGPDVLDAGDEVDGMATADADTCPGDPCQISPACGCTGQVCDLDLQDLAGGSTACRDVTVPGTEISNCASSTECAAEYMCLSGQCRAYCGSAVPCASGLCVIDPVYNAGNGVYQPIPGVDACSKSCSPEKASANGCPGSPQFGCHLVNHDPDGMAGTGDEFYYTDCRSAPATGGGDGAACPGGDSDCRAGFECVSLSGNQVCKQLCIVPNGACGVGSCSSLSEGIVIDAVEYGVCL